MFSGEVEDTCFDKKKKAGSRVSAGFTRVNRVLGRPTGSTRFRRANSLAGFYLDPDRSQARVGRVSGRPVGSVRVSKLCNYERYTSTIRF